jgi:hypothetical protein
MRDVNSDITQAYYEVINNLNIPVYQGEEPDNVKDKIYVVISAISSNEKSTKNSSDMELTIQLTINSWDYKYNNTKSLNTAVNQILSAIKPEQNSVLDLSSFGLQMLNLSIQTNIEQDYGRLVDRTYVTRVIIFKQHIFIL